LIPCHVSKGCQRNALVSLSRRPPTCGNDKSSPQSLTTVIWMHVRFGQMSGSGIACQRNEMGRRATF